MARYDDLNTNMIAYATVLSIVVLVIVLQGTQALTYNMVNYEDTVKETRSAAKEAKSLDTPGKFKSEQIASLNGYKKVQVPDESSETPGATKEVIQIPIEEAQKLVIQQFASPK